MKKTISTYLLTLNDVNNLKTYSIKPFNMLAYEFTRESFKIYRKDYKKSMKMHSGIYILFNPATGCYYIGETENINDRLIGHLKEKDWWTNVFAMVSDDFDMSTRKFFEKWLINDNSILNLPINKIDNKNSGVKQIENQRVFDQNVNRNFEYVLNEFLKILQPSIPKMENYNAKIDMEMEFYLKSEKKGYDAKLIVTDDNKFKLLKGSRIMSYINTDWLSSGYLSKMNEIKSNPQKSKKDGEEHFILLEDIIEEKPSFLSDLVAGSSGNGWVSFKNKNGKTLSDLLRKELNN